MQYILNVGVCDVLSQCPVRVLSCEGMRAVHEVHQGHAQAPNVALYGVNYVLSANFIVDIHNTSLTL